MQILEAQDIYEGIITVQRIKTDEGDYERVKQPTLLVGICHDQVNDKVMLFSGKPNGTLLNTERFPSVAAMRYVADHERLQDSIELATGAQTKGAQYIMGYMDGADFGYAPVALYYVNFDSRTVEESDNIRLLSAKDLYQEVTTGRHDDMAVIYGAHYLKMRQHNLIK